MRRVDDFYATWQIPQSIHKAVRSEVASATLWSAEIRGIGGSGAVHHLRRVLPLSRTAVGGWRRYASRGAVSLGLLGDVVLVSSGASLSSFGQVYQRFRKLRVATRDRLRGTVAGEVVAASLLQLVASTSLRWDLFDGVGASDAISFAGGAVWPQVPRKVVEALYSFGETRGSAQLLSTSGFPEPLRDAFGHCVGDQRAEAGGRWRERHGRRFSFSVSSARLIRLVQGRRKRVLIGLDSTQLLTNGPPSSLWVCFADGSMNTAKEGKQKSLTTGFSATAAVASWRALSVQPLGSQADRWRRLVELLRATDVERNPGVVHRGLTGRSAVSGRDLILHDVQPSCFAPRGLRSLDDCICGRPRSRDQVGGFPPMSVSLQGMGASRRNSIHLSPRRRRKPEDFQRRQRIQVWLVPRDC